jgi:hypothetical protein
MILYLSSQRVNTCIEIESKNPETFHTKFSVCVELAEQKLFSLRQLRHLRRECERREKLHCDTPT